MEKKANLILTEPPYGVSFQSSDGLSIQNDSIKGEEFYQFLLASMQNMVSVLEPGGAAYVFHAATEGLNFRRAFVDADSSVPDWRIYGFQRWGALQLR